ncbi:MAG: cytochrome C oxidase subunit IV family protein [Planctomycetes bacterium]|nr:cytochrome C oxidase subunit IV family protein [Planctomycetota bacterium]
MSDHSHDSEGHIGHVLPLSLLLKVFGALVALTILTVITGKADFHGADLAIAMVIATCKASLVCFFFMHLKYDRPFHGLIFLFSVMFVGLFLAFVTLDTEEYQEDIREKLGNDILQISE